MDANTFVAGCVFGVSIFLYTRLQPKNRREEQNKESIDGDNSSSDISAHIRTYDINGWKAPFFDETRFRTVSANLLITYNNNGLSEEVVRVENTDHYLEKGVFRGFCETRQVHDTYFYDFIRGCIDLGTGERVEDVQNHLLWKYDQSSEKTVDLISYKYSDLLHAFNAMMKNGLADDHSLECVRNYFCRITGDTRLTNEQMATLFADFAPLGDDAFEQIMDRIRQIKEFSVEEFLQCCEEISIGDRKVFLLPDNSNSSVLQDEAVVSGYKKQSDCFTKVSGIFGQWLKRKVL